MRAFAVVVVAVLIGGTIGWQVGKAMVPPAGELETAVYPALGAGAGILVALAISIGTIIAARSSRGRGDL